MLNERQKKILDYINQMNKVTIHELINLFKKSEATIRNDLRTLDQMNQIQRVHGGAIKMFSLLSNPYNERVLRNPELKRKIAKKAGTYIVENDVILLDSGTSILALTEFLPEHIPFKVITGALHIAEQVSRYANIEVHMIGGVLNSVQKELYGPKAVADIKKYNVDKAFVSISAFDLHKGLTENHILSTEIKRAMIATANQTFVLADASKANKINFETVVGFSEIDVFITDDGIPKSFIEGMKQHQTKLIIVE